MKLTLTEFLSLDGVCQGPGSPDEDTSGGFTQGGWFVPHMDDVFMQQAADWLAEADALLLGRRTYEEFAQAWPNMPDPDEPFARTMNGLQKYVASNSLSEAGWNPATILSGDVPSKVAELKRQPGRDLQIHGSARLGQSMLAAGLVDELRLVVAPVIVGSGRRLFPDGSAPTGLKLVRNESTPGGLAIHVYETTGRPEYGTYEGPGEH
ncbi:bifunctional deaminase-reductase domain-containing protein [Arthrobacter crystallopoietes BAB-32]|uniref:Bifunctional deaminase-reductase domain-containing protein n=1 Tax=Arthrobacter crystallopoietes BAB-32 TaxID=1246476 RepID=N1UZU9_9MICC|nr:dihydrofolate reductase family protein [Arthrobacter crystallopoietes]EMY33337.1 bifunctional deaminase-reductase domain-containing protein [Arthrobacter crystallopoietes BAB-32]